MSRASRYLKALLVAMILFAGAPVSASHANAHFGDPKFQIASKSVNSVDTSDQDRDSDGTPLVALSITPAIARVLMPFLTGHRM